MCAGSGDEDEDEEEPASGPARRAEQKLDSVTSRPASGSIALTGRCTTPRKRVGTKRGAKGGRGRAGQHEEDDQRTQTATGTGEGRQSQLSAPGPGRAPFVLVLSRGYLRPSWYRATSLTNLALFRLSPTIIIIQDSFVLWVALQVKGSIPIFSLLQQQDLKDNTLCKWVSRGENTQIWVMPLLLPKIDLLYGVLCWRLILGLGSQMSMLLETTLVPL